MNHFKNVLIAYILPVAAVFAVLIFSMGYDQASSGKLQVCKHPYALCTSALCIPQPNDPSKTICFCDVEEGPSMSSVPCGPLQPSTDANGIRTVYSTFSFKQFADGKKAMKCPSGTPWNWCLNKRCTVDPSNPKKAICVCDIIRTGEWMTLGGDCDTSTCETGYWSGATLKGAEENGVFLTKALGLDKSPAKWCQEVSQ